MRFTIKYYKDLKMLYFIENRNDHRAENPCSLLPRYKYIPLKDIREHER